MRRRISWLVLAATTTVVVSFVIPLCLLVQTLAEDRAMANADQEARNVAILVTGVVDPEQMAEVVKNLDGPGGAETAVLTVNGQVLGSGTIDPDDPEVKRALSGEAFEVVDDSGGRVLLPVVNEKGTSVVRTSVSPEVLHAGVTSAWLGIVGLGRHGRRPVASAPDAGHGAAAGRGSGREPHARPSVE